MSLLDNIIEEQHVDIRQFTEDCATVRDYYRWHLRLTLPWNTRETDCDRVLADTGGYVTEILSRARAVVDCAVTHIRLHAAPGEPYEPRPYVLPSGIMVSLCVDDDIEGPSITVGLDIVRGTSLRCLMRLLHMIAGVQKHIHDKVPGDAVRFDYDGPDARRIQAVSDYCLDCWLRRDFTESANSVRVTTEFVLETLGYDRSAGYDNTVRYGRERHSDLYYPCCAFKMQNFRDLATVRRRPGWMTLPMNVGWNVGVRGETLHYEICGRDFDETYFKYYLLAVIVGQLSNDLALQIRGVEIRQDHGYASWMRLVGDYKFYCQGIRPEQTISFQHVFDVAAEISVPVNNPEDLTAVVNYINTTSMSVL